MPDDVGQLISERICALSDDQSRFIVSISGPPGAGKSTFAEVLLDQVNTLLGEDQAVVLPMDGFHLDNAVLEARGHLARKGAPHTFDSAGFAALMHRVKRADADVVVPVFDRDLDLARAGGRVIRSDHRIVLVEGNYLLLNEPGWSPLFSLFDFRLALVVDEKLLTERLVQRWLDQGLPTDAALKRAESNDLPNARLVTSNSLTADCLVSSERDGWRLTQ